MPVLSAHMWKSRDSGVVPRTPSTWASHFPRGAPFASYERGVVSLVWPLVSYYMPGAPSPFRPWEGASLRSGPRRRRLPLPGAEALSHQHHKPVGTMLTAGLGACPAVVGEASDRFAWTRAVPYCASQAGDGRPISCSPRRKGAKGLSPAPACTRTLSTWAAFFYLCCGPSACGNG